MMLQTACYSIGLGSTLDLPKYSACLVDIFPFFLCQSNGYPSTLTCQQHISVMHFAAFFFLVKRFAHILNTHFSGVSRSVLSRKRQNQSVNIESSTGTDELLCPSQLYLWQEILFIAVQLVDNIRCQSLILIICYSLIYHIMQQIFN